MALELRSGTTWRTHPLQKLSVSELREKYGHLFTPEALKDMAPLLKEAVEAVHANDGHELGALRGKPLPGTRLSPITAAILYAMAIASARRTGLSEQTPEAHHAILDDIGELVFTKTERKLLEPPAVPRATIQQIADTRGDEKSEGAVAGIKYNISRKLKFMGLEIKNTEASRQPLVQLIEKHEIKLTPTERLVFEQFLKQGKTARQAGQCLPRGKSHKTTWFHINSIYEKLEWALLGVDNEKLTEAERAYLKSRQENREARGRPRKEG